MCSMLNVELVNLFNQSKSSGRNVVLLLRLLFLTIISKTSGEYVFPS